MWIMMNDSMLSIVRHTKLPGMMLVRARLTGDIERVFPHGSRSWTVAAPTTGSGPRFPKRKSLNAVSRRLLNISYPNFKASVRDSKRHDAYMDVWSTMHTMQEQARK